MQTVFIGVFIRVSFISLEPVSCLDLPFRVLPVRVLPFHVLPVRVLPVRVLLVRVLLVRVLLVRVLLVRVLLVRVLLIQSSPRNTICPLCRLITSVCFNNLIIRPVSFVWFHEFERVPIIFASVIRSWISTHIWCITV